MRQPGGIQANGLRAPLSCAMVNNMAVALDRRVRIPESVLSRELDGELVVLNLSGGTYFSLDPVGTRIWQLIQTCNGRLEAVVPRLLEEFAVDEQRARVDLLTLVSTLKEHGLVEWAAPTNA